MKPDSRRYLAESLLQAALEERGHFVAVTPTDLAKVCRLALGLPEPPPPEPPPAVGTEVMR